MTQLPRAQKAVSQHEPVDIESAVLSYQSPLLRYAAKMLHGQHDLAQDLVQEAFVRLHQQIQSNGNKPLQDPKPWLYRVLHNLIIDNARRNKRSETTSPHDHWHEQPTLESLQKQDIWQLRSAFMHKLFPVADDLNVLEAGSGPAHDSIPLAQRGANITALDCSTDGLQLAKQFYQNLSLPLKTAHADLRNIPFEDKRFDLAFNGGVLEHFTDVQLQEVIDEMVRVVRPGDTVLAFCPNRHNVFYQHHLKKIQSHSYDFERAFTAAEMKQRFESRGLSHVQVSGVHVHPAPNYFLPTWLPKYHRI